MECSHKDLEDRIKELQEEVRELRLELGDTKEELDRVSVLHFKAEDRLDKAQDHIDLLQSRLFWALKRSEKLSNKLWEMPGDPIQDLTDTINMALDEAGA